MKTWFKEMLSQSDASSCMRFCVVVVVLTIMANFTFLNVVGFLREGTVVNMSVQEIASLLGVLGLKLGQKKLENK